MTTYVIVQFDGTVTDIEQPDDRAMVTYLKSQAAILRGVKEIQFAFSKDVAEQQRQNLIDSNFAHAPNLPDIVRIEATNHCNAKCTFCPRDTMLRPKGIMSIELYCKIVDECAALGVRSIQMQHHGESLLDKHLPEKIKYAKDAGIKEVGMISNGELLNQVRIGKLIDAGLDGINISMDAGGKISFESTRVGLRYNRVVQGIEDLVQMRSQRKSPTPRIVLSFVYQGDEDELNAFSRRWAGVVDVIRATPLHNWATAMETKRGIAHSVCSRLWQTITVLWDGRIALCSLDFDGAVVLGNANTQTLEEIWNGDLYVKARTQHLQREGPSLCMTCDLPVTEQPDWYKGMV